MSISVTSPGVALGFIRNAVSADASSCETILEGIPGKRIKIRHLTINCGSDPLSITIGEGETDSGVTTALLGPIAMAANASLQWVFSPLLELAVGESLTVDASGAGAICVFTQGRIE